MKNKQALLETANSASEHVSGLHVAFMAVCAYVLVIVFGTTDLDLLIGKGVMLPVLNADVPIVGFYVVAPYIVVLVHFNLLLKLQLLSRKLFAIGGLRDRLHIFQFTYYLVGRPSSLMRFLLGIMVSITLVLLPLMTLLALQLQFLAYQSEFITWWQRGAIWLDLLLIVILWPIILDRQGRWCAYWREIITKHIPRRRVWVVFALLVMGLFLLLFGGGFGKDFAILGYGFLSLSSLLELIFFYRHKGIPCTRTVLLFLAFASALAAIFISLLPDEKVNRLLGPLLIIPLADVRVILLLCTLLIVPLAVLWHPQAPRGSLALLWALYIGIMSPIALLVHGERLDQFMLRVQGSSKISKPISELLFDDKRRLDLDEQVLLAKSPKPETLALIRSGKWREALEQIEPINLSSRNLRHARMDRVVLIGADLSKAQLQGAFLFRAELQGANLKDAQLQDATLSYAKLQGADLSKAQLQGAFLTKAELQGANLKEAKLQGAYLSTAKLQGANLKDAKLQGTDLSKAELKGVDLFGAQIYGLKSEEWKASLIDVRRATWEPLSGKELSELTTELQSVIGNPKHRQGVLDRLMEASRLHAPKPQLDSCLAMDDTPLVCQRRFDPDKPPEFKDFTQQLHAYLGQLGCESPEIAHGLIQQIKELRETTLEDEEPVTSLSREALQVEFKKLISDNKCKGLQSLSAKEKNELYALP